MIKYSLYANNLNPERENYYALIQSNATLDLTRVIEIMIERGCLTNAAGAEAVLNDFFNTVEYLLLYGFRVSTRLVNVGLSIQGTFESAVDSFDPKRHQLKLVVTPNRQFVQSLQEQAKLQKKAASTRQPRLWQYLNPNPGQDNQTLTPGGAAQVTGHLLSFDPGDPAQGIFLLGSDGNSHRVEVVLRNTPGDLIFMIPAGLPAGEYRLEVRALFGATLRRGVLEQVLRVG